MDDADRAALNDFSEEALKNFAARNFKTVERGKCLNCGEPKPPTLYCDDICQGEAQERDEILRKTGRAR